MSFSFSFPSLIFFSGYDCNIHGHHQQQALDTECDAVGNDNGYYSAKSEKAFVVVDEFAAHGDRKIVHHMDNSEEFGYEYMDLGQVELYEVWEAITAVSSYQSIADTIVPTHIPTPTPSRAATDLPTLLPTISPTVLPSLQPTISPTSTVAPSILPTIFPTLGAGETYSPSLTPTNAPTQPPAVVSLSPSLTPTISPSTILSAGPTIVPSVVPTKGVTYSPTLKESSHERILFSASQVRALARLLDFITH